MLWLCIQLPAWPLQVASRGLAEPCPLALVEGARILQANTLARQQGVRPGQRLGTAHALAAGLRVVASDAKMQQGALERLACWAWAFTDKVLLGEDCLWLEVAGSLRLWGPLPALIRRLEGELAQLGYSACMGLAPVAEAARLLAPGGIHCLESRHMLQHLMTLPCQALPLPAEALRGFERTGLRSLGDLFRMPRAALRRRFGVDAADCLDRLCGEAACKLPRFNPPDRYRGDIQLPAPLVSSQGLLFASRRLLAELGGFLAGRDAGVSRLQWQLTHEDRPDSHFSIALSSADRDMGRWLAVLREHLRQWRLPAPAERIVLRADELLPFQPRQRDLLGQQLAQEQLQGVTERLTARLGHQAVGHVTGVAEHRPEYAWRHSTPFERLPHASGETEALPRRPLWLMAEASPVDPAELHFLSRAERIETGWWDGAGYTRDYFVADAGDGRRLWVYNEHKPRSGWYIQGVFG